MNKEFYLYKVISLLIISVFFCSCSKVKNEPVKVIQTDSFSNALEIKVKELMRCLQDAGYTRYNLLTTKS